MNSFQPLDVFIHIPKAGGITMYQILQHNYPPGSIWKVYPETWEDLRAQVQTLSAETRAQLRMLTGHIPYGVHTLLQRPARYFTLLRDPIERVLSYYYYVRSHPDNPMYDRARALSLEEYIQHGLLLDNGQVRWLANVSPSVAYGQTTPEMLQTACQNLESFAVVGLVEHYDESLLLLKHQLGWRWLWYRKRNTNSRRPTSAQIPAHVRAEIAQVHALDCALYQHAQRLFVQQWQSLDPAALQREKKIFQAVNTLYALISRLRHPRPV